MHTHTHTHTRVRAHTTHTHTHTHTHRDTQRLPNIGLIKNFRPPHWQGELWQLRIALFLAEETLSIIWNTHQVQQENFRGSHSEKRPRNSCATVLEHSAFDMGQTMLGRGSGKICKSICNLQFIGIVCSSPHVCFDVALVYFNYQLFAGDLSCSWKSWNSHAKAHMK